MITVMAPSDEDMAREGCFPPRNLLLVDGWHIVRTERGDERMKWVTDEDEIERHPEARWWLVGNWERPDADVLTAPTSLRGETWRYVSTAPACS